MFTHIKGNLTNGFMHNIIIISRNSKCVKKGVEVMWHNMYNSIERRELKGVEVMWHNMCNSIERRELKGVERRELKLRMFTLMSSSSCSCTWRKSVASARLLPMSLWRLIVDIIIWVSHVCNWKKKHQHINHERKMFTH